MLRGLGSFQTKQILHEVHGRAREKQLVHWFLGGKGLGIQQGTSVWVRSPKSEVHSMIEIWASQPIHSLLVGRLNPCHQGTSVRVVFALAV